MEIDPIDLLDQVEQAKEAHEEAHQETPEEADAAARKKRKGILNSFVAVSVALLATFIGICKVKDDNVVQAMQQAQANRIDDWSFYQARNIREEVALGTVSQLQVERTFAPPETRKLIDRQIALYQDTANREHAKKLDLMKQAQEDQNTYDLLNYHDDQFDLSEASMSLAISLFAITSLTQKRWLFFFALFPALFGITMGVAGLANLNIHPDGLVKLLSELPADPTNAPQPNRDRADRPAASLG